MNTSTPVDVAEKTKPPEKLTPPLLEEEKRIPATDFLPQAIPEEIGPASPVFILMLSAADYFKQSFHEATSENDTIDEAWKQFVRESFSKGKMTLKFSPSGPESVAEVAADLSAAGSNGRAWIRNGNGDVAEMEAKMLEVCETIVRESFSERKTTLKILPRGPESVAEVATDLSPAVSSGGVGNRNENGDVAEMEASERLKKLYIYFLGRSSGTISAASPNADPLNYDQRSLSLLWQVFVRDFFPKGLDNLMKSPPKPETVNDFLLKTIHIQGAYMKKLDQFTVAPGVIPASFCITCEASYQEEKIFVDFEDIAIGRVAPVDSGLWSIILLRLYTKCIGDHLLADQPEVQRRLKLIVNLCLSDGFDTFPTLLCADAGSMINRRMGQGMHDYPVGNQALFFFSLKSAQQMLKPGGEELNQKIENMITALSYHVPSSVGNCIAILSSSATLTTAMDLIEELWEELIGKVARKTSYPTLEGCEGKIGIGCDRKNICWCHKNGGSWPGLLQTLDARHLELFLSEVYQGRSSEYKRTGLYEIKKNAESGFVCNFELSFISDPSAADVFDLETWLGKSKDWQQKSMITLHGVAVFTNLQNNEGILNKIKGSEFLLTLLPSVPSVSKFLDGINENEKQDGKPLLRADQGGFEVTVHKVLGPFLPVPMEEGSYYFHGEVGAVKITHPNNVMEDMVYRFFAEEGVYLLQGNWPIYHTQFRLGVFDKIRFIPFGGGFAACPIYHPQYIEENFLLKHDFQEADMEGDSLILEEEHALEAFHGLEDGEEGWFKFTNEFNCHWFLRVRLIDNKKIELFEGWDRVRAFEAYTIRDSVKFYKPPVTSHSHHLLLLFADSRRRTFHFP